MKNKSVKSLCINAVLTAFVCVATMLIQIPVPATSGYIHLGDSVILIAGIFFGWKYGMIAGGLGSAIADILTGYAYWAPFTLIIKGLMGFAVGKLANSQNKNTFSFRNIIAASSGILIMIAGYLVGGTILKGSFFVSLTSVPFNLIQGVGGLICYLVMGFAFNKMHLNKYLSI